jgi:integrase/recombinase XerD
MKKEIDIHNYPKKLKSAVALVERSDISDRDKKIILDFRDYCSLNGIGIARTVRYMGVMKDWAKLIEVDFDKVSKEDITRAVRIIQEREHYSAWTKSTYKSMLKRFYKWLKNTGDEYPEEVKWINSNIKRIDRKLISNGELLTEEEVQRLINLADHPRDKALISLLYESGARIGEAASLQICNLSFDEHGVIINVEGKTGSRPIRLISSVPYLTTWLNNHPFRENKYAPLWINIGNTNHNSVMNYPSIRMLLKRLFVRANIQKRFNPHMFRHSRATFLADHLTEFQMNQYFGWIQGSKMPSTYIHMSGKIIDSSILALNGIQSSETKKESVIKPKICSRCETINTVDSKFCSKCANVLDTKTAFELQEKLVKEKEMRNNTDSLMNILMKDPDFLNMFVNKVKELGLSEKIIG